MISGNSMSGADVSEGSDLAVVLDWQCGNEALGTWEVDIVGTQYQVYNIPNIWFHKEHQATNYRLLSHLQSGQTF